MIKYYWDELENVLLDSNGNMYQAMCDGEISKTNQPLILYGHEVEVSKKIGISKLLQLIDISFDEDIEYHKSKALELENKKMFTLMKARKEIL